MATALRSRATPARRVAAVQQAFATLRRVLAAAHAGHPVGAVTCTTAVSVLQVRTVPTSRAGAAPCRSIG
jgi:hypothetical protein